MPCECFCASLGFRADPYDVVVRTYLTDPTFNMALQQNLSVSCIAIEISLTGSRLEGFAKAFEWEVLKSSIVHLRELRTVIFAFRTVEIAQQFASVRKELFDLSPIGYAKIRCIYYVPDFNAWSEIHPIAPDVVCEYIEDYVTVLAWLTD